jgi:hypothetical protein
MTLDGVGYLYVADTGNGTIRQVLLANGLATTLAVTDNTGAAFKFKGPTGVALSGMYTLYVADRDTVYKIALTSREVTIAASGFISAFGLAADGRGNLYVTDYANQTLSKVVLSTGMVTPIAGTKGMPGSTDGTGQSAAFNGPAGVALDGAGNLYVADSGNGTIRKVSVDCGTVTTLAGQAAAPGIKLGPLPGGLLSPTALAALSPPELAVTVNSAVLLLN